MYIKNFLLFFILTLIMAGCSSKYENDSLSTSSGQIFQSASLEHTIRERDLKFK